MRMMEVLAFIILGLVGQSFQGTLFTEMPDVDTSDVKPCVGDDIASCEVVLVDVSAFNDNELLLPNGVVLTKKNDIQEPLARDGMADQAKSEAYVGEGCEAVFSFRGAKVMGSVDFFEGSDFVLEPCSNFEGCHVWKEMDSDDFEDGEGMEPDADMSRDIFSSRSIESLRQDGIDDSTTIVEYSIKYYYTIDFAEATDDIDLYMDQVTAETNQGYINSNIPVRIRLFCIEAANIRDINDGSVMLTTFTNLKGNTDNLRGSADAAALILLKFQYCGIGYVNTWTNGWTITAQTKGCALGYFTMGHELGHNFGCMHDNEHSSSANYPYAFGNYIGPAYLGGSGYRTIMAYNKVGYGKKANYYSSPDISFMGYVTGSELQDNARVIRENRFGMAAVGDESGTCAWGVPTTAAPTTVAPTTVAPTTVAPTTVAPTTVAPTTVAPTTVAPTTGPTTEAPPTGNTTVFPTTGNTTAFPTTEAPTTGPTTEAPGPVTANCTDTNVNYLGVNIGKARNARRAVVCERRCKRNRRCDNWTWFTNKYEAVKMREKCIMRKTLSSTMDAAEVVSGRPASCV